jgi:hypothetical protein
MNINRPVTLLPLGLQHVRNRFLQMPGTALGKGLQGHRPSFLNKCLQVRRPASLLNDGLQVKIEPLPCLQGLETLALEPSQVRLKQLVGCAILILVLRQLFSDNLPPG